MNMVNHTALANVGQRDQYLPQLGLPVLGTKGVDQRQHAAGDNEYSEPEDADDGQCPDHVLEIRYLFQSLMFSWIWDLYRAVSRGCGHPAERGGNEWSMRGQG